MLTLNKLFLALAFLGSSAAAQAADGNADVSRIDYGKNSEKTDRVNGIRRSLSAGTAVGTWNQSLSQQHVDHPYCVSFENLTCTHNGLRLTQENLLGSYDVKLPLATAARLSDAGLPPRGVGQDLSWSLSESQYSYLPVYHLL